MGVVERWRAAGCGALIIGAWAISACAAETEPASPRPVATQVPMGDGVLPTMSMMPVGGGVAPPQQPVPTGDGDGPALPPGDGDGSLPAEPIVMPPVVEPGADPFDVLGTDPARNQVQAGQVCERLATIQCAGEAGCCSNAGRDFSACFQSLFSACKDGLYLDVITGDPIAGFDAARAATTFDQMESLIRACDPTVTTFGASPNGLMGIIQGTVAAGGSCKPAAFIPSAVQAAPHLASCSDPGNYACMPAALGDWTCDPKGGAGQPCITDVNCQAGLYCPQENPTMPALSGVNCAARKPLGQPCSAPNQCESLACKGGSCVESDVDAAYCLGQ